MALNPGDELRSEPARLLRAGWRAPVEPITPELRGGGLERSGRLDPSARRYGSGWRRSSSNWRRRPPARSQRALLDRCRSRQRPASLVQAERRRATRGRRAAARLQQGARGSGTVTLRRYFRPRRGRVAADGVSGSCGARDSRGSSVQATVRRSPVSVHGSKASHWFLMSRNSSSDRQTVCQTLMDSGISPPRAR